MLGWEFPPYFAGGVGVVAEALTRALSAQGVEITYVMPRGRGPGHAPHMRLLAATPSLSPGAVSLVSVPSFLGPYDTRQAYTRDVTVALAEGEKKGRRGPLYGADLLSEVNRFAEDVVQMVAEQGLTFDLIHAHDWTTFPAALALRKATGKPAVVHVHITEFDKSGSHHADPAVYAVERRGLHGADRVICVSHFTARQCIERYGVPADSIAVIHNAVETGGPGRHSMPEDETPLVLFVGRMTLQKGPDYFLDAARRVLDVRPDVNFVMAGEGDMLPFLIERSAAIGLNQRMAFTGFASRDEVRQLYDRAAVFVMPSVSEPFGLVPLEAMDRGVPTIVSRQSGVSEVIQHVFKVDFWDSEATAARILAALQYAPLATELRRQGLREVRRITWQDSAAKTRHLYHDLLKGQVR